MASQQYFVSTASWFTYASSS
uniref:Uncharacterized protein n=1 Tax=Anguilla anguilla TaxID=7936 RepID=A0A0E9W6L4_ANGAN